MIIHRLFTKEGNIDGRTIEILVRKFENRQYAEALEIFVPLYNNGYKKEWILKKL